MTDSDIFYEYEQILLGKRRNYASEIFAGKSEAGKEAIALQFFKCVMEKYLNWTPEQAYHMLNKQVIEIMKLKPLIRYIKFPAELNSSSDFFYIVTLIYPDKFKTNERDYCKLVYKRVKDGELPRYPKKFFEGRDGQYRALFCLKYAINEYATFRTPEDLYKFFCVKGEEFLKSHKLMDAFNLNYDGYPVDYLHDIFNKSDKDAYEFIYRKYRFFSEYNDKKKN